MSEICVKFLEQLENSFGLTKNMYDRIICKSIAQYTTHYQARLSNWGGDAHFNNGGN